MNDVEWAILARLVRPQGRHGEILADLLTDFPERFAERRRLFLVVSETSRTPPREVTLERHWLHKGRVVLKFSGIDSINAAKLLRGLLVAIPASERVPLSEGSVYISDLIGCEVVDVSSAPVSVGKITDVDRESALLMVQAASGGEILVPFARAYLAEIDLDGKRIEMRLPEGLLDINAPMSEEECQALNTTKEDE
jgi:16S rRNA processing protein RimM